jgi:hypothetical protein
MKKFYALMLLIALTFAGCMAQPLPTNPVTDKDGDLDIGTADDGLNIKVDNTTPVGNTDAIDSQTLVPDKNSEVFPGGTSDTVVATDYYTLAAENTTLTPRAWLDAAYQDYSSGWKWDFNPYTLGYDGTGPYNGFLAVRKEPGMYVEYVLIPQGESLYVFRTETPMKLSPSDVGYAQERQPRVKEMMTKLYNKITSTPKDEPTVPTN